MFKNLLKIISYLGVVSVITSCANRGNPSGGEKDVTPPRIVKSIPENFSTNFNASEIKIYFDEYIKIKNIQKQLIISPPMDTQPDITPLGSASKYIKIKILDTLQPNTTYAFNFGQSIVDNNEENPYSFYKYVFSTGSYIDSLSVKGQMVDAKNRVPDQFVSVMLYEIDSTFTDSIVYKQKPKYITNTLDSTTTFNLENLKAGKYFMVAMKDANNNYTFQQKTDKIGFHNTIITIPTDSVYSLKLFKEELNFKVIKPRQESGQKIAFGYEGDIKNMKIDILENTPDDFESRITKDKKTDTLYYWYKPKFELDSTKFVVRNKTYIDTLTHKFKDIENDSLIINPLQTAILNFNDNFTVQGTIPFTKIDEQKISILDKDSTKVSFVSHLDSLANTYAFHFEKLEQNTYKIQMLPDAFTDFFGNTNDTLKYNIRTKLKSDYGDIRVSLKNAVYPVIVQLTNEKNEVKAELYSTKSEPLDFRHLDPSKYYLRVIYDTNKNKKYDTGNYLLKRQPERVSYYGEAIELSANWERVYEFTLE